MTRQEAKRWVCERIRGSLSAGLVEDEASTTLTVADQKRVRLATQDLIAEFERRASIALPTGG